MAPSYRLIDYRIRPSKHVERIMLAEAFRRQRFHAIEDYQYVGLGSVFFTDFRVLHKALGITQMFSIEKQEVHRDRFEWNKPYSGINILFGHTEKRLSDIDFSIPTIIWLDYDGSLDKSVISDIRAVSRSASHGAILVVTVNAHPRQPNDDGADMLEQVSAELGNERISADTDLTTLRGWGLADFYRRVGTNEIEDSLSNANGVRDPELKIEYEQIFNFRYEDGARMATFGGVFFQKDRRAEFEACAFERLNYIRNGIDSFRINAPKLTLREIAYLERQLPLEDPDQLDWGAMPENDAKQYMELYRYLPTYLPVDFL